MRKKNRPVIRPPIAIVGAKAVIYVLVIVAWEIPGQFELARAHFRKQPTS